MAGDIVSGSSGAFAYDVALSGGKLVVTAGDPSVGASLNLSLDGKVVLELIKSKLPAGITAEIGDAIIGFLESALLAS